MKVEELMSSCTDVCRIEDTVNRAAQIMWENNCGVVPVIDAEDRVVGLLTDRDVCMAAYTQGRPLWEIPVASACSKAVFSCQVGDSVQTAENVMRVTQVRRLPVLDAEGKLCGVLSLGDLARNAHRSGRQPDGLSYQSVALTLAAVSQPSPEGNTSSRAAAARQEEPARSEATA